MNTVELLDTQGYKTVEHMVIVGLFVGLSAAITEIITLLSDDKTIAVFVTNHAYASILLVLVNMALAGVKRYIDLKKQESLDNKTKIVITPTGREALTPHSLNP